MESIKCWAVVSAVARSWHPVSVMLPVLNNRTVTLPMTTIRALLILRFDTLGFADPQQILPPGQWNLTPLTKVDSSSYSDWRHRATCTKFKWSLVSARKLNVCDIVVKIRRDIPETEQKKWKKEQIKIQATLKSCWWRWCSKSSTDLMTPVFAYLGCCSRANLDKWVPCVVCWYTIRHLLM